MGLPIRWDQCPDWQRVELPAPQPLRRTRRRSNLLRQAGIALGLTCGLGILGLAGVGARDLLQSHETPTLHLASAPTIGKTVGLASASVERRLGFVTVTGNATNMTAQPVGDVEAVVELLNADGHPVRVESALLTGSLLGKASGPFSVVMNDNPKAVSYRVQFRRLMGGTLN